MKTITTSAIMALMTAAIGLSAVAPTFAQDAGPMTPPNGGPGHHQRLDDHGPGHGPRGMGGGDFLNFDGGSEAIEIALVRLSHRIELTAEQQPLFDALKTAALAAADDFATATEGLRPVPPAEGETATATTTPPAMPDLSERLENRIALETAKLDALKAVQPSATAFFDSLTDEQKTDLMPQGPGRDGMPGGKFGGPGRQGQLPGAPEAGAAPADAPAAPAGAPADAPADPSA